MLTSAQALPGGGTAQHTNIQPPLGVALASSRVLQPQIFLSSRFLPIGNVGVYNHGADPDRGGDVAAARGDGGSGGPPTVPI